MPEENQVGILCRNYQVGLLLKKTLRLRIPKSDTHNEGAQFTWIPQKNQRLRNMLKKRVTLEESMQFRV